MIEIKYHKGDKPGLDYVFKFYDVDILDDKLTKLSKRIRFYFIRHDGERDWWVLYPYEKYVYDGEEPVDYIKIDGELYTGDDLYRLAREIIMKKEAEVLDILEG